MLRKTDDIVNVLFFDLETVSEFRSYDDLSEEYQKLWRLKAKQILKKYDEEVTEVEAAELYTEKAGIYAEFGKICCISAGVVRKDKDGNLSVHIKSYSNHDEKVLLQDFSELLNKSFNSPQKHYLCGHNIKEFDVPYTCRRMLKHQMPLPNLLNVAGKKPWDLDAYLLDTMTLWKFGDYKSYTALKLLTAFFDIPSPKDDIDGSEVGSTYWELDDLERIAVYCEKDVLAVVQLLLKYHLMPIIPDERVAFVGR